MDGNQQQNIMVHNPDGQMLDDYRQGSEYYEEDGVIEIYDDDDCEGDELITGTLE